MTTTDKLGAKLNRHKINDIDSVAKNTHIRRETFDKNGNKKIK